MTPRADQRTSGTASSHTATTGAAIPAGHFTPVADGTVDIPPVNDPHHMQALQFWSRFFDCSIASVTEAHARLGRRPGIQRFTDTLKRIAVEEEFADTTADGSGGAMRQYHPQQPATMPAALQGPARTGGRVAAWLNRKGTP